MRLRSPWLLVLLACLPALAGCADTATVKGRVRFQGRAVVHGSVTFVCADQTARSAVIQPDGTYTVEGVRPGEVRIAVTSRDPAKGRSTRFGEPARHGKQGVAAARAAAKGWFPLPASLEDPDKSGLRCTVSAGRTTHDIEVGPGPQAVATASATRATR